MRRRVAYREGVVVGAAIASSRARAAPVYYAAPVAPVVVGAPASTVVVTGQAARPPPQEIIVQTSAAQPQPPYQPPPPAYGPPPPAYAPAPYPGPAYPQAQDIIPPSAPLPTVSVNPSPPVVPAAATVAAIGAAEVVAKAEERRHFMLVNEANCSVLMVEKACLKPGTYAVIDRRRPDKSFHQIWYLDAEGVIRSKLTDFALEGKRKDERVRLVSYMGDARQQWVLEGNRIVNKMYRSDCLSLRKHLRLKDDADVIVANYEGKPYQHWRMEPVVF